MDIDFVLCSRSCSSHDALPFSAYPALPGSLFVQGGSFGEFKRRRSTVASGGFQCSSFVNRSDRNCVWRSPECSLEDHHHYHHHHHHHHQHQHGLYHTKPGFAGNSCHHRLGLGFSGTAELSWGDVEENLSCENLALRSPNGSTYVEWEKSKIDLSNAQGAVAGVGVPLSLRMLKRKQQGHGMATLASGVAEVGNSLLKAFSSIVFMMKELQSHSLYIRQHFFKQEIEDMLKQVHRDMHTSFLWLFQKVFSCTPELMMLLMVLLADFTAFSIYNRLPVAVNVSPSVPASAVVSVLFDTLDVSDLLVSSSGKGLQALLESVVAISPSPVDTMDQLLDDSGGRIGDGGGHNDKGYTTAGGDDDPSKTFSSMSKALHFVENNLPSELSSMGTVLVPMEEKSASQAELVSDAQILSDNMLKSDFSSMAAALACEEFNTNDACKSDAILGSNGLDQGIRTLGSLQFAGLDCSHLDWHVMKSLVAPVTASIEDDNYTCFDRTDLAYQYAISSDATNSMLLANYAQFLFLVRKDHDRAEKLFYRAVSCDPLDGDANSRFASFLWLARHNLAAAGRAFQAAVLADPSNPFHAGEYAHFLWNSGQ